ncbi:hypothetical protein BLA29_008811 [Euroglyphus maynei]|uniref:Band 7 domain-containing protein n=1 Tax=Euroglyphus maynei TaxID=6958 RepID=A0A1Y3BPT4_EURMA|nr:hypothetical protein BLA29_008811 [Euroglyphus maynei]
MGIDIVSLTIKDIYDNVEYLDSLGRTRIAQVKRDAQIIVTESERDCEIIEAECEQKSINQTLISKTKIEAAKRQFEMKQSEYQCELNRQQVKARLAYEIQTINIQQSIQHEEKTIELIEKHQSIHLEQLEMQRLNEQLIADVLLPADIESNRILIETEARKNAKLMMTEAKVAKIRQIGLAEVIATKYLFSLLSSILLLLLNK